MIANILRLDFTLFFSPIQSQWQLSSFYLTIKTVKKNKNLIKTVKNKNLIKTTFFKESLLLTSYLDMLDVTCKLKVMLTRGKMDEGVLLQSIYEHALKVRTLGVHTVKVCCGKR